MFEAQELDVQEANTPATTLFDACCSGCLVTHDYAKMANLEGKTVKYYLKSTGFPARLKMSMQYKLTLPDRDGVLQEIVALGIDDITDLPEQPGVKSLRHLFPQAPDEAFERPTGAVDLLIGANYRELQPAGGLTRDGCQKEGLRLTESRFGCGWIISGTHKTIGKEETLTNCF